MGGARVRLAPKSSVPALCEPCGKATPYLYLLTKGIVSLLRACRPNCLYRPNVLNTPSHAHRLSPHPCARSGHSPVFPLPLGPRILEARPGPPHLSPPDCGGVRHPCRVHHLRPAAVDVMPELRHPVTGRLGSCVSSVRCRATLRLLAKGLWGSPTHSWTPDKATGPGNAAHCMEAIEGP